jgi:hypothetical protein
MSVEPMIMVMMIGYDRIKYQGLEEKRKRDFLLTSI